MKDEINPCPLCGALPCDWVDDPHKHELGLCWTLAKIREALGVNEKPMMDELPGIVAANMSRIEAQATEIARLREVLGEVRDWIGSWSPEFIWDDEWLVTEAKVRAALGGNDE